MDRTIISRAGWNSRGPKKPFSWLNKKRVQGIALHHSGIKNGPKGMAAVQAFEKHHMDNNGWNAIAYNWLVDEQGVCFEGRGAGVISAATRPYNSKTESICYTGDGDAIVPMQALESIRWLISDIQKRYDHKLWVKGHRDLAATACPGSFLYNWLQAGMPVTERNLSSNELSGVKAHIDRLGASLAKKPLSKRRKSRGEAVRAAQERLKALGFDPGPVDGVYGKLTKTAVLAFQRRYRDFLIQDGIIGANTWRMLFS
tara:strand:- start:7659 stop:8429 length:771 start_codon:yes stop_codon:yes gene_type:complete